MKPKQPNKLKEAWKSDHLGRTFLFICAVVIIGLAIWTFFTPATIICPEGPTLAFEQLIITAGSPQNHAEYAFNVTVLNGTISNDYEITSYIDNFDYVTYHLVERDPGNFSAGEYFTINVVIDYSEGFNLTENQTIYFVGGTTENCRTTLHEQPLVPKRLFDREEDVKAFIVWWDPERADYLNVRAIYENLKWADENKRYFRKLYFWHRSEGLW